MLVQLPTLPLVAADMPANGHWTDVHAHTRGKMMGDLLRTPLLLHQQGFDLSVDEMPVVLHASAAAASPICLLLHLAGHIQRTELALRHGCVAADLATDRTGVAFQYPGNAPERAPLPLSHGQGVSFRLGALVVHTRSPLAGGVPFSLPAHSFNRRPRCCTYFANLRGVTIHSSRTHSARRLNSAISPTGQFYANGTRAPSEDRREH